MSVLNSILYYLSGQIPVPDSVNKMSVKILHLSDTPSHVYRSLIRFVSKVKPDILIHTGDIADDIKLELIPGRIETYKREANYFLSRISPYVKGKIIIVPGNHDNTEVLNIRGNITVCKEGAIINTQNASIGLSHKFDKLPADCSFYLYGHDKATGYNNRYLNGIEHINIIDPVNMEVIKLPYPTGTDDYRLKRTKIGI